ncbi:PAS domain-containing protein [Methylobacterium brachiatum]|uniref:PAS domain-containing protein n=1 Tax=Methylobacterium brachiatum TaxID=269660 RepID=UPI000EFBD401|nr:PAS domain-containing protein [Methylobacterium brachiatum]AYO84645.1 PAS domain S-box protein [Methylobacterium brachiatum]MDH2312971.1 PAS domain-containing protein [Methylobacterium brachiatum]
MGQRSKTPVNAIDGFSEPLDRLRAALEASCVVGVWDWDIVRHVVVYDAGAARLLAGDPALAETELDGSTAIGAVHPADHAWLLDHVQQASKTGGLAVAEYRVVAPDGTVRWLLSRGRMFQDANGRPVRSRGIIIDITEMHQGSERYVMSDLSAPADALERAADLAIALKRTLDGDTPAEVRAAADVLLMSLGRAIARSSFHR